MDPSPPVAASPTEQLRAFVNALPDLLFVLDEDGRYVEALSSQEALFYAESKLLVGRLMHEVLPKDKADLFLDTVRKTIETQQSQVLEYELTVAAGLRFFEGRTSPLSGIVGGKRSVVWVSRDITERKRAEEELRSAYEKLKKVQAQLIQSEKLASIGMLVSGLNHEINNPLNVVFGNLKLLEPLLTRPPAGRGRPSPRPLPASRVRRMFRDALKAAGQAKRVVEEFRHFSRDTKSAENVDVNECLAETQSVFARTARPRIALKRSCARVPAVRCFRGQIAQVFLNLLRNAEEAIDGKGVITLATKFSRGKVRILVTDTGRGIEPHVIPRIFEPFFTTKPFGSGLGIGLSLSALIVQNHGGRITVRTKVGSGSTFEVSLPPSPKET